MDESDFVSDENAAGVNGPRAQPLSYKGFIRFKLIMTKYSVYAVNFFFFVENEISRENEIPRETQVQEAQQMKVLRRLTERKKTLCSATEVVKALAKW